VLPEPAPQAPEAPRPILSRAAAFVPADARVVVVFRTWREAVESLALRAALDNPLGRDLLNAWKIGGASLTDLTGLAALGMDVDQSLVLAVLPDDAIMVVVASETLADGRSNILLYGTQRLRIVEELHTDEPFRRVATEPLPDLRGPEDDAAADRLRRIALQISDSVPGAHQILGNILASARSPSHLGNLLAAQVLDPISLRQACLEEQHVATRLDTITDALGSALLHLMDDTESKGAH
jgi:hypothetical protein